MSGGILTLPSPPLSSWLLPPSSPICAGSIPITGGDFIKVSANMPLPGQKVIIQVLHFVPTGVVCSVNVNLDMEKHASSPQQRSNLQGLISNHELATYKEVCVAVCVCWVLGLCVGVRVAVCMS